jgi:superfamily II DNA or RNA helicase
MSLAEALARKFSPAVRYKGDGYSTRGLVRIVGGNDHSVDALVRGTSTYRVRIHRDPSGSRTHFTFQCSCAAFAQYAEPCKHLWATLQVAERAGHLQSRGARVTRRTAQVELAAGSGNGATSSANAPDEPAAGGADEESGTGGIDPDADVEIGRDATADLAADAVPAVAGTLDRADPVDDEDPDPPNPFIEALNHRLVARSRVPAAAYRFANAEMLFAIDAAATSAGYGLVIEVLSRTRAVTGEWNKPQPARITPDDIALAPAWDRRVFAPLIGAGPIDLAQYRDDLVRASQGQSKFRLPEALAREVVPTIARSGRGYLRSSAGTADLHPVRWDEGGAWRFKLDVTLSETDFQIGGHFERGDDRLHVRDPILVLPEGFLVTRQTIARWDPDSDLAVLATLRATGPVTVALRDRATLAQTLSRAGVPDTDLPPELRLTTLQVTPWPRIRFNPLAGPPGSDRLLATVSFDYDGTIVPNDNASHEPIFDAERLRLVARRPAEEAARLAELQALGITSEWDPFERRARLETRVKHLSAAVRALVEDGWHVEGEAGAYRSAGSLQFSVTSGIDWFDLEATADFGGQSVPLTDILGALRRGDGVVRLGDGSIGLLPEDWLRRYLPLTMAGELHGGKLRFRTSQTALLDALLADRADDATVAVDQTFDTLRRQLETFSQVSAEDPPSTFTGTLRPYQREGLGWFTFLRRFKFGGCLADDMGLGKTVMVLALLDSRRAEHRPSLIIVPRSLVSNWMSEGARFAPHLRLLDYSHTARAASLAAMEDYDAVLCTYGTLRRDVEALKQVEFDYLILDEAQAIKNAATASAKAVRLLEGRHRLALSGTPIENHLGELWSLFEFLNPGILGSSSVFQRATAGSGAAPAPEFTSTLSRGLRPFILRRTKSQVARELPERTEQTLSCELSGRERALYDSLKRHYRAALLGRTGQADPSGSKLHVLEALLRLRQASCHPGLVDARQHDGSSAKFDVLLPRLREVIAEGHKALVFSQFTSLLALLRRSLDAEKITYEYLDGRTRERAAAVQHFQEDPSVGLFLISLKAGGLGLNLTAAEYVFLLDPWWNPAVEAQAIDRAHRIGQTREVIAYRLIAKDTVEEKVITLQQSKRALADAVLSADAVGLRHLTREDLELLLS